MQEKNRASCNKGGKEMQKRILLHEKKHKKIHYKKENKKHQKKNKTCYMKKKNAKKRACYKKVCHINRKYNKCN